MIQLESGRLLLTGYWEGLNGSHPDTDRYTRTGWGLWRGKILFMEGHRGVEMGICTRKVMRSLKPGLPLAVMGAHPWCYRGMQDKIDGNLRGMLLDTATWAQEGLMDDAVAAGYYRDGGTPRMAFEALQKETQGKVGVWLYGWVPRTAAEFERDFALARKLGARRLLFWEADYIDSRANREELQRLMRARAQE